MTDDELYRGLCTMFDAIVTRALTKLGRDNVQARRDIEKSLGLGETTILASLRRDPFTLEIFLARGDGKGKPVSLVVIQEDAPVPKWLN